MDIKDSLGLLKPALDIFDKSVKFRHTVYIDKTPLAVLRQTPCLPNMLGFKLRLDLKSLLLALHDSLHN